jgi:hypothetical protein
VRRRVGVTGVARHKVDDRDANDGEHEQKRT